MKTTGPSPEYHSDLIGKAGVGEFVFRAASEATLFLIWRLLSVLGAPFARALALYVWFGKVSRGVSAIFYRMGIRTLGWLGQPTKLPWLKSVNELQSLVKLRRVHLATGGVVAGVVLTRALAEWRQRFDLKAQRRAKLRRKMAEARDYETWGRHAQEYDALLHNKDVEARWQEETRLYDINLLRSKQQHLATVRENGTIDEIMFALRADLVRNLGNMTNKMLYENRTMVPRPIRKYIAEVKRCLLHIRDYQSTDLPDEVKLSFLQETRLAFGRTALLLSGGGGLGAFHLGVIKALFDHDLLPGIIAGSSVGSIVGAIVCTHSDEELRVLLANVEELDMSFFKNNKTTEYVSHLLTKGTLHDMEYLVANMRRLIGDYTFLQAFEHTGRIFNVVVCAADTNEPPRLLNYLTAPQALVWSAVSCSSAFPGLFPPQDLIALNPDGEFVRFSALADRTSERRWRDGSLEDDLPMRSLSEMFNANYFIVSQTNPHIVPLMTAHRIVGRINPTLAKVGKMELKHRCNQLRYLLPDWGARGLNLLTQPWEGDITMTLPFKMCTTYKAISNPTKDDLVTATHAGELASWPKLGALQCNCGIEATLDACLQAVGKIVKRKHVLSKKLAATQSSRIPSWLCMQSLGLVQNLSGDSMISDHSAASAASTHGSNSPRAPENGSFEAARHRQCEGTPGEDAAAASGLPSDADPPNHDGSPITGSATRATTPVMTVETCAGPVAVGPCGGPGAWPGTYASGTYAGGGPEGPMLDCCDPSVNLWSALLPLVSSAAALDAMDHGKSPESFGLDVIAP